MDEHKRVIGLAVLPLLVTGLVLLVAGLWVEPVEAQCGASATSCKNCHEVNAKYPVNGSGAWHTEHAFGDFCAFCHAGNVQAVEADAAHEGMIYPLSDLPGSCQSCHPGDYQALGEQYAVVLGVTLTVGGGGGLSGGNDASNRTSAPISAPGERNASGALIDFNRRYEIEVLGRPDFAVVGNGILWGALVGLTVFGGWLVWHYEGLGKLWKTLRKPDPDLEWLKKAYSGEYPVSGPVLPKKEDKA